MDNQEYSPITVAIPKTELEIMYAVLYDNENGSKVMRLCIDIIENALQIERTG